MIQREKLMTKDVTNSPKNWDDFWYNSKEDHPNWTNNETPPNHMPKVTIKEDNIYSVPDNNPRKSFDELYNEYSAMSIPKQIENLKGLGRELFNKLDAIIDNLDVILEGPINEDSNKQVD